MILWSIALLQHEIPISLSSLSYLVVEGEQ